MEQENYIWGRNTVLEAMKAERKIDKLFVIQGEPVGSLKSIVGKAKTMRIPITWCPKQKLDEISQEANNQGIVAFLPAKTYVQVDEILDHARSRGEEPFVVILDELTDITNVGAIIRSAECCGVHGVIVPKRRSALLNSTVAKTSSGAMEYMMISQVSNISQTIDNLKKRGVWVVGADMDGENIYSANLKGPMAIVIGAEGKGISKLVKEKCDFMVKIPMKGQVQSLNASVAAGIMLYEKMRQEQ